MQIPEIAENIPAIKAIRASGPGATGHGTDEQSFFPIISLLILMSYES